MLGRYMLSTKMLVAHQAVLALATRVENERPEHSVAKVWVSEMLQEVVGAYNSQWADKGDVPGILIERINVHHGKSIARMLDMVELEFANRHRSVEDCMWSVFNIMQGVFAAAMTDFQVVVNGANGSLERLSFSGVMNVDASQQVEYAGDDLKDVTDPVGTDAKA